MKWKFSIPRPPNWVIALPDTLPVSSVTALKRRAAVTAWWDGGSGDRGAESLRVVLPDIRADEWCHLTSECWVEAYSDGETEVRETITAAAEGGGRQRGEGKGGKSGEKGWALSSLTVGRSHRPSPPVTDCLTVWCGIHYSVRSVPTLVIKAWQEGEGLA